MLVDGWASRMVQVDFSHTVLEQMKDRYNDRFYETIATTTTRSNARTHMEFLCHDLTQGPLPYEDASFDLVICKGVMDAILCSLGGPAAAVSLVAECHRLLAPGHGIFFVVSNARPDDRTVFLEKDGSLETYWQSVSVHTVPHGGSKKHSDYVYIGRKKLGPKPLSMSLDKPLLTSTADKENAKNVHRPDLLYSERK